VTDDDGDPLDVPLMILDEARVRLESRRVKSGALLVREWKGRIERVMVLDEGYAWNGGVYEPQWLPSSTNNVPAIS
jgi:hypothetical protein